VSDRLTLRMANRREQLRKRFSIAGLIIGGLVAPVLPGFIFYSWVKYSPQSGLMPWSGVLSIPVGVGIGALVWVLTWAAGQAIYPPNKDPKLPDVFD